MITKEEWDALPYQTTIWCVSDMWGIEVTRKHGRSAVICDMEDYYTNRVDAEYRMLEFNLQGLNNDY